MEWEQQQDFDTWTSKGFIRDGNEITVSDLLMESFGQFDTYTPLQLATYGMTLANNGERLAPHIVDGIYETNLKEEW